MPKRQRQRRWHTERDADGDERDAEVRDGLQGSALGDGDRGESEMGDGDV